MLSGADESRRAVFAGKHDAHRRHLRLRGSGGNCRLLRFLGVVTIGKSPWWLVPGCGSLVVFAWLLTLVDTSNAGRAYAAYGGIYITSALLWLWLAEGVRARPLGLWRRGVVSGPVRE